jgi:flagellar biogenesis protein FliO
MYVDYIRQLVSIAGVLGLLLAVLYILRRRAGSVIGVRAGARNGRTLQVVERAALTPQHSLHVVRVRNDLFLFSAGTGGVALLKKLDDENPAGPEAKDESR